MDSLLELIRARRAELEVTAALGRDDEQAKRLEGSLIDFVEAAWPAIDPAEYQRCWAIDALCEHLQAVSEGQIRNLLVNIPPRCGKTTIASVCYPAWTWAQYRFCAGRRCGFCAVPIITNCRLLTAI